MSDTLQISKVITGLWQLADMERDKQKIDLDQTAKSMQAYHDNGFTTFDMADHYGSAEIVAGKFRQSLSDKQTSQLLTKWVPESKKQNKADVKTAIQTALKRLQMEQIDLLQFHAWNYADPNWLDCLFWLQEFKKEGLIANIGVTNFDTAHLSVALNTGIDLVSNQISYSLLDQRASGKMSALCEMHNIKILAFGTLAGGFLSEKWLAKPDPKQNLETWSQMKYKRFIDQIGGWKIYQQLLNKLDSIASELSVSIANVATRYILDQKAVGAIIIGARLGESEHIKSNATLFDFDLNNQHKSEIKQIIDLFQAIPGDCGDEYRKPPFLTASGDLSHHLRTIPAPFEKIRLSKNREQVLSGTVWEKLGGFSRAIRTGNIIRISGTTATHGDKVIGGNDPYAQTHAVIDKIEAVMQSFDSSLSDIVRTRVYIRNMADWESVTIAHGERFAEIQPANTLVRADIIGDDYLVEIEAEAEINEGK